MEDRRNARLATNDSAGSGSPGQATVPVPGAGAEPRKPLPTRVEGLPRLPRPFHAALERGLGELGIELDDRQLRAIDAHARLLVAWNAAINLTAITDPARIATQHVVDSLTAVEVLRARRVNRLLDLGSGAGFPGLPLAVAMALRGTQLVESVGKKASFLAAAAGAVSAAMPQLRVEVRGVRAEALAATPDQRGAWPAVTARAVASLADLVELAFPLLAPAGCLVAWKRGDIDGELEAADRAIRALGGGQIDVLTPDVTGLEGHRLVVVTRLGTVPAQYPRDPRARRRRPW